MTALAPEDGADLHRWIVSGVIVVLAHAGIAAWMVSGRQPAELAEPAAAIVIELAPVPVGPATPVPEVAPGPEQVMSDASPSNPVASRAEKERGKNRAEGRDQARTDS